MNQNNCVTRSYPVQLHEPTAQTGKTAYRQLIYGPHACLPPHCRGETGLRLLRRGSLCSHSRLLFKLDERRCSVLPSRGPHANLVLGSSRSVLPFLLSVCVCVRTYVFPSYDPQHNVHTGVHGDSAASLPYTHTHTRMRKKKDIVLCHLGPNSTWRHPYVYRLL